MTCLLLSGMRLWLILLPILATAEEHPPALERIMAAVGQVESGFNPQARSPKNAVGVWQLIPETARRFGLRVDATVDERTDTPKATVAAARYLRYLFDRFGDWQLTLAAYNAGEARVQSAIARAGTRQFDVLKAYLPAETAAYVPAVLAIQAPPEVAVEPPKNAPIVIAPFSLAP